MKSPKIKSSAGRKTPATTLSLDPEIKSEAIKRAKETGETLTGLVERLLLQEIASPSAIVSRVDEAKGVRVNSGQSASGKLHKPDALSGTIIKDIAKMLCGQIVSDSISTSLKTNVEGLTQPIVLKRIIDALDAFFTSGGRLVESDPKCSHPSIVNGSNLKLVNLLNDAIGYEDAVLSDLERVDASSLPFGEAASLAGHKSRRALNLMRLYAAQNAIQSSHHTGSILLAASFPLLTSSVGRKLVADEMAKPPAESSNKASPNTIKLTAVDDYPSPLSTFAVDLSTADDISATNAIDEALKHVSSESKSKQP